jgi:hypothetical protein
MAYATSQSLFTLNQELLTLSATQPSIHTTVDCFNFTKPSANIANGMGRTLSAPVPTFGASDDRSFTSASIAHFSLLADALSSAFPDFDFTTVCPWNFKLIPAPEQAQANINWAFQTQVNDSQVIVAHLWSTLEKEISPGMCSIYSYESDRPDAFSESGAVYNLCYFFLNERMGKVVLVNLMRGGRDLVAEDDEIVEDIEERYGYAIW